jgi:hypothetical protein
VSLKRPVSQLVNPVLWIKLYFFPYPLPRVWAITFLANGFTFLPIPHDGSSMILWNFSICLQDYAV